jgi:hypothetical protein
VEEGVIQRRPPDIVRRVLPPAFLGGEGVG